MNYIYKKFDATKEEISKKTEKELRDTVKQCELTLANGLKAYGMRSKSDFVLAILNNCGRCSNVACRGSNIATKKPAVIRLFTNDFLPLSGYIEANYDLFFGNINEDPLQSLKVVAKAIEYGIPTLGRMMLAIAYCDGRPSADALKSIKEFYGE